MLVTPLTCSSYGTPLICICMYQTLRGAEANGKVSALVEPGEKTYPGQQQRHGQSVTWLKKPSCDEDSLPDASLLWYQTLQKAARNHLIMHNDKSASEWSLIIEFIKQSRQHLRVEYHHKARSLCVFTSNFWSGLFLIQINKLQCSCLS